MIGQRFGLLVVTGPAAPGARNFPKWQVRCDCGAERVVFQAGLRAGASRSCGSCIRRGPKCHMYKHGQSETPLFQIWLGVLTRCTNEKNPAFPNYGGRGITICQAWRDSFEAFAAAVGQRPSTAHTLERSDNNGNYEPGNVRWATRTEQARNRRDNVMVTHDGQTRCLAEWSELVGLPYRALRLRLRNGWTVERALNEPHRGWGRGRPKAAREMGAES